MTQNKKTTQIQNDPKAIMTKNQKCPKFKNDPKLNQEVMQRPCAPKARRPTFGPLCIHPTILPFLCSCPFLVSIFTVGLCVLWVLCGPSKATARCYTSICDGIIFIRVTSVNTHKRTNILIFFDGADTAGQTGL